MYVFISKFKFKRFRGKKVIISAIQMFRKNGQKKVKELNQFETMSRK